MTKAMPFLQKTILLSYDPRPFAVFSFSIGRKHMNPRHAERAGQRCRSAACGGYSEARLAQRSKWRTDRCKSRFGHRKRACEASSSPSAPASEKRLNHAGLSRFFVSFLPGARSALPHFDAQIGRQFRIGYQPFAAIPSATSSK